MVSRGGTQGIAIFFFLLCTLSRASAQKDCLGTSSFFLFRDAYYAMIEDMQRGVPKHLAAVFYAEFQSAIANYVLDKNPTAGRLNHKCIPTSVTDQLIGPDGSLKSLQRTIKNLEAKGFVPSYLSRETFPSEQLPDPPNTVRRGIDSMWSSFRTFLNEPPRRVYEPRGDKFPQFYNIMHDPLRPKACFQFWRYGIAGDTFSSAQNLTARVIAFALELHMAGVSQDDSYQILLHHGNYIFNGFRCMREHGPNLEVPLVFPPVYASLTGVLVKDLDYQAQGSISDEFVMDEYFDLVRAITYYKAWGTNGEFVLVNGTAHYRSWRSMLFDEDRLEGVRAAFLLRSQARSFGSGLVMNQFANSSRAENDLNVSRGAHLCYHPWRFEPRAKWKRSVEEKCCPHLCYESALYASNMRYSIVTCCALCNQFRCDGSHHEFDKYTAIVPEFGVLATRAITILI